MEVKLQKILFPDADEHVDYHELFYKAGQGVYDREQGYLAFAKYSTCDFSTYLNSFSYKKWMKHTKIRKANLKLTV